MLQIAMPMNRAQIQEEICALVNPAACPAWNIRTNELVQPVIIAIKPATTAAGELSANGRRRVGVMASVMWVFLNGVQSSHKPKRSRHPLLQYSNRHN